MPKINYKVSLDKNGFAEKTAWITGRDGFLVLDRNGNGIIDNGGELFSDQVIMSTSERSVLGGFQALADLDGYVDSIEVSAITTPDNELARKAVGN